MHSKIFLWHVVEVITPSLFLSHSIFLIFLNLPAQSEVRISFSLSLINLLHLPFFYFPLPPPFTASLALPLLTPTLPWIILTSCFLNPPCSVCLPLFSAISPLILLHVTVRTAEVVSALSLVSLCLYRLLFPFPHLSLRLFFLSRFALSSKSSWEFCIQSSLLTLSGGLTCSWSFTGTNSQKDSTRYLTHRNTSKSRYAHRKKCHIHERLHSFWHNIPI